MNKTTALLIALSLTTVSTGFCKVNNLIEQAIKGNPEAQLKLAEYYESKGYNALMLHWYEKAAAQDNIQIQERLAQKFFNSGDTDKAIKIAQNLLKQDNAIGKSILSYYYSWGAYKFPIDKKLSLKLAQESCNVPLSKAVLANFYFNGFWGIKKDYDKAVKLAEESLNEGCEEGGCIRNRIANLSGIKDKAKYQEINERLEKSKYVDGVLNAAYSLINSENQNFDSIRKMVEPYLGKNYAYPYIIMASLEENLSNSKKEFEYRKKAAELWNDDAILAEFFYNLSIRNFDKAKEMVVLAFKTQNPNLIAQLYFLFNEDKGRVRDPNKTLPDNTDWKKLIKIGADNGHPILMLLHARNIGKENEDYQKYMSQAKEMGVSRILSDCYIYCKDLKKWVEIGIELQDIKAMRLLGSVILNLQTKENFRNSLDYNKKKKEAIKYLEYAAEHGDDNSAYELYSYYNKIKKQKSRLFNIFSRREIPKNQETDKVNNTGIKNEANTDIKLTPEEKEVYEKAYIWGKITKSLNPREQKTLENLATNFTDKEIKELDEKVEKYKNQIDSNVKEDNIKITQERNNYMPLSEIEFIIKR